MSNKVSISLPTSGCGIRLSSRPQSPQMVYSLVLVAQQDRHLRQIADQEKYLECFIRNDAFAIKSQHLLTGMLRNHSKQQRIGRMKNENQLTPEALLAARAWMEITPDEKNPKIIRDTLEVGEPALLTVKSTLPAGVGWKVVECTAHDGLGDSSQKLLDEAGCPVDEFLMPQPRLGTVQSIKLMRHQEAVSRFFAFKFPDRDRLHLVCRLQLCRGVCSKVLEITLLNGRSVYIFLF